MLHSYYVVSPPMRCLLSSGLVVFWNFLTVLASVVVTVVRAGHLAMTLKLGPFYV